MMFELPPPPPFEDGEEPYPTGKYNGRPYVFSTDPEDGPNPTDWKPTPNAPLPTWRCEHIKANGERCRRGGIRGTGPEVGLVTEGKNARALCVRHGGSLPHVKKLASETVSSARMILLENVEMASDELVKMALTSTQETVKLKAITELMDRAGVIKSAPELQVEVTHKTDFAGEIEKRMVTMANRFAEQFGELADEGEIVDEPESDQEPTSEE